jgi:hypothetical protein
MILKDVKKGAEMLVAQAAQQAGNTMNDTMEAEGEMVGDVANILSMTPDGTTVPQTKPKIPEAPKNMFGAEPNAAKKPEMVAPLTPKPNVQQEAEEESDMDKAFRYFISEHKLPTIEKTMKPYLLKSKELYSVVNKPKLDEQVKLDSIPKQKPKPRMTVREL